MTKMTCNGHYSILFNMTQLYSTFEKVFKLWLKQIGAAQIGHSDLVWFDTQIPEVIWITFSDQIICPNLIVLFFIQSLFLELCLFTFIVLQRLLFSIQSLPLFTFHNTITVLATMSSFLCAVIACTTKRF